MIRSGCSSNLFWFRPNWTMRVYHNATSDEDRAKLCEVACANGNLDLCDISAIHDDDLDYDLNKAVPTVWRFLTMADPKVSFELILTKAVGFCIFLFLIISSLY